MPATPATALFEIRRAGRLPLLPFPRPSDFRNAARAFLSGVQTLRQQSGFQRWQAFRAMDATDALLLVVDWNSAEELATGLNAVDLEEHLQCAQEWGLEVVVTRNLSPAFERALTTVPGVAMLLRLASNEEGELSDALARQLARVDDDQALQALAAPSSLRVTGARSGGKSLARVEFDSEDGIWHFLDSPLRKRWSRAAEVVGATETWAINLPRLDRGKATPSAQPRRRLKPASGSLSVGFSYRGSTAALRLQGTVDSRGTIRCEQLCEFVLREGCARLEVDVSGLQVLEQPLLVLLSRTARTLRERGGDFVVIDNEARVRRVTRNRLLEASVR